MRQEIVTYDIFCQAIQKMQLQGEKISVRAVHSHIGGSFAKVAGFLRLWQQEQTHAKSLISSELSTNLRQAILAEIGKAVTEAKALLEKQLAQANSQLDETCEAIAKQEKALADYDEQVTKLNQELAVANQLQEQQVEKIQALEKKLEQSMQSQHEVDKRAVIAETRCAELEKQLVKWEKEMEQLKVKQNKKH